MRDDTAVHLAHCFQGEYEDSCKYGFGHEDDAKCPAKAVKDLRDYEAAVMPYDALQMHTTEHVLHTYEGPKGKLEFVQCTRHMGRGSEVEYEIRLNGFMCDFDPGIGRAAYMFNEQLKKLKPEVK